MNKVAMTGRPAGEPEVRYTTNNDAVANFRVAVERRYKKEGQPDADFFKATAFGKTAEFIEKYVRKGQKIAFTGRLQNDEYTNRDGQKVSQAVIIIEEVEFCEKKEQKPEKTDDFMDLPKDEQLPFNF